MYECSWIPILPIFFLALSEFVYLKSRWSNFVSNILSASQPDTGKMLTLTTHNWSILYWKNRSDQSLLITGGFTRWLPTLNLTIKIEKTEIETWLGLYINLVTVNKIYFNPPLTSQVRSGSQSFKTNNNLLHSSASSVWRPLSRWWLLW